jgi:hypothetical protein
MDSPKSDIGGRCTGPRGRDPQILGCLGRPSRTVRPTPQVSGLHRRRRASPQRRPDDGVDDDQGRRGDRHPPPVLTGPPVTAWQNLPSRPGRTCQNPGQDRRQGVSPGTKRAPGRGCRDHCRTPDRRPEQAYWPDRTGTATHGPGTAPRTGSRMGRHTGARCGRRCRPTSTCRRDRTLTAPAPPPARGRCLRPGVRPGVRPWGRPGVGLEIHPRTNPLARPTPQVSAPNSTPAAAPKPPPGAPLWGEGRRRT